MARLAEVSISPKHVQRLTVRLGGERQQERDGDVAAFRAGRLRPRYADAPAVAAIHLDAGKLQMRTAGGGPGVRDAHWVDTKVACLQTYTATRGRGDPQPEPPAVFLDPPRVLRLCREMERVRSQPETLGPAAARAGPPLVVQEAPAIERPQRLVRTAVATLGSCEPFGWQVAAEAQRRGLYHAQRKAVLGDGGNWIGPLAELHFPGWVQVLDFLHLLVHLYAAAGAAYRGQARRAWGLYERCLRAAWAGRVAEVLANLAGEAQRLGPAPPNAAEDDPRRIVALVRAYVQTNAERMDYARYRQMGLPISSAPVESLIKQFNFRVKGTEKFWGSVGAEAVLQVRAAYLSDDDRGTTFHERRPHGRAVGQHRLRPAA